MFVIGTAGHVDHGKSALVKALTGIDPDRLQEEKERGMTIDLGFAWLKLPSGREVSIVDVPGHERFVKNMLAGVGGIDLALLVIAADEGIMPQTREHLAILDLLRVKRGIIVITKVDLVDREWLELVTSEVRETVAGTTLAEAPLVAVSAVTREGLQELMAAIDRLLDSAEPRKDIGRPRLPIDRVFTMSGFGTVVTGTLIDGQLTVGQEVEVLPDRLKSRIRGLQTHKQKVERAVPGSRVAANLVGVATTDLERGDVLTTPGWLVPTTALDARLRLLPGTADPLPHNATVTFHVMSSEVVARVRLLDKEKLGAGETGWAQLRLESPVAVVKGDLFIIRSARGTVGGGEVIDPQARRHRRFQPTTIEGLATMEKGTPEEILLKVLEKAEPCRLETLVERSNLSRDAVKATLEKLVAGKGIVVLGAGGLEGGLLFSTSGWQRLARQAQEAVHEYHKQFPLRSGMPREELKSRLKLPARVFNEALPRLAQEKAVVEEGAVLRLPSHQPQLTRAQQEAVDAFLRSLEANPYSPPTDRLPDPELLNLLLEQGKVVRVAEGVVFSAAAYRQMVERITGHIRSRGKITVAEVRDMFNTSRKYALALMEHLDEQKVTRRVGDERVLR